MKRPLALLSVGLALVAFTIGCTPPEPTTTTPPSESPLQLMAAPASYVEMVAEKMRVGPPPTPTPTPPCPGDATKKDSVLSDTGGSYSFDPSDFTFTAGECVEFTLTAGSEFHTFTVDELDINQPVDKGETITFRFTFEKAGEFNLICVPHQEQGMVGKITVR